MGKCKVIPKSSLVNEINFQAEVRQIRTDFIFHRCIASSFPSLVLQLQRSDSGEKSTWLSAFLLVRMYSAVLVVSTSLLDLKQWSDSSVLLLSAPVAAFQATTQFH